MRAPRSDPRAVYDFTLVQRLDKIPELDRTYVAIQHLPRHAFGTKIRRRLLLLNAYKSIWDRRTMRNWSSHGWRRGPQGNEKCIYKRLSREMEFQ
jgi:hypothetical protein